MSARVKDEIKQRKPFRIPEEEAFVTLQRTADALMQGLAVVLKPAGLSPTQYNVLRILRGAGAEGLPCGEIASRMVTRDPDMTRLLDRLETRGLVSRSREKRDRRVVMTRISPEGQGLLAELDDPVLAVHRRQLGHLGARRIAILSELLDAAREPAT